jgi:hypothetical protein
MIAKVSTREEMGIEFSEFERDGQTYLLEEAFSMTDLSGFQGSDSKVYRTLPLPVRARPLKGIVFSRSK